MWNAQIRRSRSQDPRTKAKKLNSNNAPTLGYYRWRVPMGLARVRVEERWHHRM